MRECVAPPTAGSPATSELSYNVHNKVDGLAGVGQPGYINKTGVRTGSKQCPASVAGEGKAARGEDRAGSC